MFKVSHSKIKTYKRCHKQYDYKYNQKLRKRIKNKNLYLGSMVHECLEAHFRKEDVSEVITRYEEEYKKLFEEERVELEGSIELGRGMVDHYIEYYSDDEFEVVEVEKEILVNLEDDLYLEGKIDLIIRDSKGKVFINEHKTCKGIPEEQHRMSDIQTVLYTWALKQEGQKCSGVIWDYLKKKLPVVPELLKKGGLSKAKNIDTTHKIYLQAIHDNDLAVADYLEILDKLKDKQNTFLRRIKLPFNDHLVSTVIDDTISTAKQIRALGTIATDRNPTMDCSWCDYYNLCQAELRGLDTEYMRKKEYVISQGRPKRVRKKKSGDTS